MNRLKSKLRSWTLTMMSMTSRMLRELRPRLRLVVVWDEHSAKLCIASLSFDIQ